MIIKIVICFIIIGFIPVVSASDALWTARSSGFIGMNESIVFENYLVKARVMDDTTSSISIYKNTVLLETAVFRINDVKYYDNISINLPGINGERSWISINKLENKEFWRFIERRQLNWGDSYVFENHSFSIDTYGRDSVNLTISNRNLTEKKELLTGEMKNFETFRISIANINRTGFIDIDFFTNRLPDYKTDVFPSIKAEIITDKDEYFPDETVNVSLKVSTDFNLNVIGMTVKSSIAQVIPDHFSMIDFSGEHTFGSKITGQAPNTTGSIDAMIDVRDYSGNSYVLKFSKDILIKPEIAIIKRVQADTDDENVPVLLYVYNSGTGNKSVHIEDMIPAELAEKSLDWDIDIGPKSHTILEYNVTAPRPGQYFLPPATAQWDGGGDVSKRMKMMMHMPYITLEKSIVRNDSNTLVKLAVTNSGDRPAQVIVSDKVPSGHPVISGDTAWTGRLDSGENMILSYYLEGEVENLPDAEASYLDIRGVTRNARSNTIISGISVKATPSEKSESTKPLNVAPSDLVLFMVTSFIAITGIFTGAASVVYLISRTLR